VCFRLRVSSQSWHSRRFYPLILILNELTTSRCGPFKLAKILDHCLDRYEEMTRTEYIDDTNVEVEMPSTNNLEVESLYNPLEVLSPAPFDSPDYVTQRPTPEESFYTVLIADDNSINRRLLIALINKHNLRYYEAVNGLQALQIYKKHHASINVVLMDISMPVMDGMTSTRHIRTFEKKENLGKTMVIALTGLVSASARLEALESGVDEFMTKPVNFGRLVMAIDPLELP